MEAFGKHTYIHTYIHVYVFVCVHINEVSINFLEYLFMSGKERMLKFVESLFNVYGNKHISSLRFIIILNYVTRFANIEPFVLSWNKIKLVMVYFVFMYH